MIFILGANIISFAYEDEPSLNIDCNSIENIKIQSMSGVPSFAEKYNYDTDNVYEIKYISHLLNSLEFGEAKKPGLGSDGNYSVISIQYSDKSEDELCFTETNNGIKFITASLENHCDIKQNGGDRLFESVNALKHKRLKINESILSAVSDWAKDDIDKAVKNGLVPKLNQIDYAGKINRLEVCQLADNLLQNNGTEPTVSKEYQFEDTDDISVKHIYSFGIINGKTDTEFCPYDNITREEFSKILSELCRFLPNNVINTSSGISYRDKDEISDWAVDSIATVTASGLMHGDKNGNFNPKDNITKEQAIVTLLRLQELK